MMKQEYQDPAAAGHPITPPPELFKQWEDDIINERDNVDHVLDYAWRHGFRAGADHELEACEKYWMTHGISPEGVVRMREHRRPKPLSLKEQALEALARQERGSLRPEAMADADTIRRALESLPD